MHHTVSADLQDLARLDEPGFYAGDPYPVFERLRQEAPVYWYKPGQFATWQSAGPAERPPSTHVNQYAYVPVVAGRPIAIARCWWLAPSADGQNSPEEPK